MLWLQFRFEELYSARPCGGVEPGSALTNWNLANPPPVQRYSRQPVLSVLSRRGYVTSWGLMPYLVSLQHACMTLWVISDPLWSFPYLRSVIMSMVMFDTMQVTSVIVNSPVSYPGGALFEYWLGYWLSYLGFFKLFSFL
jgi:hypothetical protein